MSQFDYRQFINKTVEWFQCSRGLAIFAACAKLIRDYDFADGGFFLYQRRLVRDPFHHPMEIFFPWGSLQEEHAWIQQVIDDQDFLRDREVWRKLSDRELFDHDALLTHATISVWPLFSEEQTIGAIVLVRNRQQENDRPYLEVDHLGSMIAYQVTSAINSLLARRRLELAKEDLEQQVKEQTLLEAKLRKVQEFQVLLSRANEAIAQAQDEHTLLQEICDLAITYTHISLCWVAKPEDSGWVKSLVHSGQGGFLKGLRVSVDGQKFEGSGAVGTAWRLEEPVFFNSIATSRAMAPWRERLAQYAFKSSAALPIRRNDNVWGILTFYHHEEDAFDEELQHILKDLAQDIGFGLDRIDLVRQERQAHEFNQILLNNVRAGVLVVRYPSRVVEKVNEKLLTIIGIKHEEMIENHPIRKIFFDEKVFHQIGGLSNMILNTGEGQQSDVLYHTEDGQKRYFDLSGHRWDKGDGMWRIIWTIVDVTDRFYYEENIRNLNRQKTILLDNTLAGISVIRYPERVIIEANQRYAELVGYHEAKDVIGHSVVMIYPNVEQAQRMATLAEQVLEDGHGKLRDLILKMPDGMKKYVDVAGELLEKSQDHTLILWTSIDVTERRVLMKKLEKEALYDLITGLPNRRYFEHYMEDVFADFAQRKSLCALIVIDLDGFKAVNDTYGHLMGDQVLRIVGGRLRQALDKEDFIARLGGDEFILVIRSEKEKSEMEAMLYRLGKAVQIPIVLGRGQTAKVGLSAGICYAHDEITNFKQLVRLADQAMYHSKGQKFDRKNFWTIAQG